MVSSENLNSESIDVDGVNIFTKVDLSMPELVRALATLVQEGDRVVKIMVDSDDFWENLSPYVGIDTDYSTRMDYARIYGCDVPMAVVEVGPCCVAPVFQDCIEGVCVCKYILCGAVCQIKPCRFAAAVMAFGADVSECDLYVLTSAYRGVRIVDHGCDCEYERENYSSITGKKICGRDECQNSGGVV